MPKELPENAERVFKGVIFEVWQWDQEMYDGSVEVFEALKRANTTQVIPVIDDKIIMQIQQQPDRPKPFPSMPGGRCEENEDPLMAAKRELLEETGYESDDWTLYQEWEPSGKIIWTVYTYIARNCRKITEMNLDAGEKIDLKLITFDELLNLGEDPGFRDLELKHELLKAKYNKEAREKLHNLLFSNEK